MTLPLSTSSISFSQLQTEFGGSNPISLSEYYAGSGLVAAGTKGYPSGVETAIPSTGSQVGLSNFHGASAALIPQSLTITSNQQELNLRTWALANGWNGSSYAEITVDTGVYIWSDNISTAAMTIDGSWPNGVKVINNGYIIGKGGKGAGGTSAGGKFAPENGGPAISLGINAAVANNSYIAGGGGGGGSAVVAGGATWFGGGGGGAGGGDGGDGWTGGYPSTWVAGPTGGSLGQTGGQNSTLTDAVGGAGGRILPGTGATSRQVAAGGSPAPVMLRRPGYGAGSGGGGAGQIYKPAYGTASVYTGPGGSAGNAGSPGYDGAFDVQGGTVYGAGGGGGWGASGGDGYGLSNSSSIDTSGAGAGGKAIALNGYTATTSGSGTTYGAVS